MFGYSSLNNIVRIKNNNNKKSFLNRMTNFFQNGGMNSHPTRTRDLGTASLGATLVSSRTCNAANAPQGHIVSDLCALAQLPSLPRMPFPSCITE